MPTELTELRTENTKTYELGAGRYCTDVFFGPVHYKDNYADPAERWKDIDLTIVDGKVTAAPFILTLEGKKATIQCKKTGKVTTIEPQDDCQIIIEPRCIKFQRTVARATDLTPARFKIKDGGLPIFYRAKDAEGNSIPVNAEIKDGILTETVPAEPGKKYPLKIDPTIDVQIGASANDCFCRARPTSGAEVEWIFSATGILRIGCVTVGTTFREGIGLRFDAGVPQGVQVDTGYGILTSYNNQAIDTAKATIIGNKEPAPAAWSNLANYQSRRGTVVGGADNTKLTSASVNWNPLPDTTADTEYNTPEIKTILQELVNQTTNYAGVLALFIGDHEGNSTVIDGAFRRFYSYDESSAKAPKLHVEYTTVAPTATTQDATDRQPTQVTANGTITKAGGTITRRGFCYKPWTAGGEPPTVADNVVYENGSFKYVGTYSKNITGLAPGTLYEARAYVVNAAGTAYGDTVQFATTMAAPTNLQATTNNANKVTLTWTKSPGALFYDIYRDDVKIAEYGDVDTYDDTTADPPVITPGTAQASDAKSATNVELSLTGNSIADGTTHTYKIKARNVLVTSPFSDTAQGYRKALTATLQYLWQRSAADSNSDYSALTAAALDDPNLLDTHPPADGSGRYYRCIVYLTGAQNKTSTPNRGYILAPPANLQATTNNASKVTLTWTKSPGALFYDIYRADVKIAELGDVDTYDDNTADPPVITPGAAQASDATSAYHVALSLTGKSIANGTTHTYKIKASNADAETDFSAHAQGYRKALTATLQYLWQRSAGDSDADYSALTAGAQESPNLEDTTAPENGDGRYYKCTIYATGAEEKTSTANRGSRIPIPIMTTAPATDIAIGSFIAHGAIAAPGLDNISALGFCLKEGSGTPTTADRIVLVSFTGAGNISAAITSLKKNTSYTLRAFAERNSYIRYGNVVSIHTLDIAEEILYRCNACGTIFLDDPPLRIILACPHCGHRMKNKKGA